MLANVIRALLCRCGRIISMAAAIVIATASAGFAADVQVAASGLRFPEGTIFVGSTLYLVDYATSDVSRMIDGKIERVWHRDGCGANGLVELQDDLLVACYANGTLVRITTAGQTRETITHDGSGRAFISPNDLARDATGGVYFTDSGTDSAPGTVYYRDASGRVTAVAENIDYANGVAVSNDGKLLYVGESKKGRVLKFEIGAGGRLSNRSEFAKLADVLGSDRAGKFTPDGLRIDRHGRLFVALYDGGGFAVLTGDGRLEKMVRLPAAHHSNLAISPDGKYVIVTAVDDSPDGAGRGALLKIDNPAPE